jgi:ubiquinone/menaquinone biosynthesis C-methylase UbiE
MIEPISSLREGVQSATWPAGRAPVAVVMISLNEAHNMEAVLENLKGWAREVFLVDSYSADATVDIALRHGVQVVQRAFRGFGDQWNFAMSELPISAPWTMKLDPDERLTDALKDSIAKLTGTAPDLAGICMQRRLWFMGKMLPVRQPLLRVWRTGQCRFSDVAVNEYPLVAGPIREVRGDLEHHDSPDLHHWIEKQNQYGTAEAVARFEGAALSVAPRFFGTALQRRMWVKKNYLRIPFRYSLVFLYNYVVLGAWRAGWVGYAWSRLRCDVYRLREYKLREMHITGRLPRQWTSRTGAPDPRVRQYQGPMAPATPPPAKPTPMPKGAQFHEHLAAGWTAGYANRHFRRRFEFVKRALTGLVDPGSHWLDAGCGSGILTQHLAALGAAGLAVDASPAMIEAASQAAAGLTVTIPFEFRHIATVEKLDIPDDTFDGVLCSSVIEYLDSPAAALREMARVLHPGGRLLVSVANRRSLIRNAEGWVRAAGLKSRFTYLEVSRATFTGAEISEMLQECGMRIDHMEGFDPVFPAWATRLLPPALIFVTCTKNSPARHGHIRDPGDSGHKHAAVGHGN